MTKSLFVWLEGPSDELFFQRIVEPLLSDRYASIRSITYAQQPEDDTNKKIREVVRSHRVLDHLWLADLDPEDFPCISARKNATKCQHPLLQPDRIAVVAPEIEAWYLAGLDAAASAEIGIPEFLHTNEITKEHFRQLVPNAYVSEIAFRIEVLSSFSLEVAKQKNASFSYFCKKHL